MTDMSEPDRRKLRDMALHYGSARLLGELARLAQDQAKAATTDGEASLLNGKAGLLAHTASRLSRMSRIYTFKGAKPAEHVSRWRAESGRGGWVVRRTRSPAWPQPAAVVVIEYVNGAADRLKGGDEITTDVFRAAVWSIVDRADAAAHARKLNKRKPDNAAS